MREVLNGTQSIHTLTDIVEEVLLEIEMMKHGVKNEEQKLNII